MTFEGFSHRNKKHQIHGYKFSMLIPEIPLGNRPRTYKIQNKAVQTKSKGLASREGAKQREILKSKSLDRVKMTYKP